MSTKVGVWQAVRRLGDLKARELLWPELTFGVLIGFGGSVAVVRTTHVAGRVALVNEVLPIAAALLAVVFAGLALVVSIPSQSYIREMASVSGGGMIRFLDPFLVVVGTQTALVLLTFGYQATATHVAPVPEHVVFYLIGFLLVFGLLDIVALARSLVRHGLNRGLEALGAGDEASTVKHLDERRRGEPKG